MADEQFKEWAALFVSALGAEPGAGSAVAATTDVVLPPAPVDERSQTSCLTPAAEDLLRSVDAGGVPTFVTQNLRGIAHENGVVPAASWTPNDIVAALRAKLFEAANAAAPGAPFAPRSD